MNLHISVYTFFMGIFIVSISDKVFFPASQIFIRVYKFGIFHPNSMQLIWFCESLAVKDSSILRHICFFTFFFYPFNNKIYLLFMFCFNYFLYTVTYRIDKFSSSNLQTAHVRASSKDEAKTTFMKSHLGRIVVSIYESWKCRGKICRVKNGFTM